MKLFKELRRPFTLNDASRFAMFDFRTPGDNSAKSAYARPFKGRLMIASRVITWPRSLESVSSWFAAPLTVTLSVTLPTSNVRSTRCRAFTTSVNTSEFAFLKPDSSALTLYEPMRRLRKRKLPDGSDVEICLTPVCVFSIVTLALATCEPVGSFTVPRMVEVSYWARHNMGMANRTRSACFI